jgi:hypothetical protein
MIRVLSAAIVAALAAAGFFLPRSSTPEPDLASAIDPPAVAVCAVEEGSGRSTTVGVVSTANGSGLFTAFVGGGGSGSQSFETGLSASTSIDVVDVAAVGLAGGLVELPVATSATGSVVQGELSLSAEGCASMPAQQTVLAGGSTAGEHTFEIQLMNPYSGRAVVDLIVHSESGLESSNELAAIIVPPRSSIVVDLGELLPGRKMLNVVIETESGSVVSVGRMGSRGDSAVWQAVPPAQDWFLPVPTSPGLRQVIIANAAAADVEYQVDLYGTEGGEEAFMAGAIPAGGVEIIDVTSITPDRAAFRVVSTGPVASFVSDETETSVSLTSGATAPAGTWLMPGAGSINGATGTVVVFNPGIEEATIVVTARRSRSRAREVVIPAGAVLEVETFDGQADGYVVTGNRPVVALWTLSGASGFATSIGTPIE